jgi:hypothetical protein
MADNGLIVLEIRNTEVAQHRGAFKRVPLFSVTT